MANLFSSWLLPSSQLFDSAAAAAANDGGAPTDATAEQSTDGSAPVIPPRSPRARPLINPRSSSQQDLFHNQSYSSADPPPPSVPASSLTLPAPPKRGSSFQKERSTGPSSPLLGGTPVVIPPPQDPIEFSQSLIKVEMVVMTS
ncbi:hypothetical protein HK405_004175, partial [Cladochytrium tenue]